MQTFWLSNGCATNSYEAVLIQRSGSKLLSVYCTAHVNRNCVPLSVAIASHISDELLFSDLQKALALSSIQKSPSVTNFKPVIELHKQ